MVNFAGRQRRSGVSQREIAEANCRQRFEPPRDRRKPREGDYRLIDSQVEHLVDITALELDREDMALEAATLAGVALHFEIGHEMHLDRDCPLAVTVRPAATAHLELQVARLDFLPS